MRFAPFALLNRLQSTYWFLPAILTVAAAGLGLGLTALDRSYPDPTSWMGWAYGGGADGARALLSAVAGSIITVVSVTFSVIVVALTVSSQHFGPRLLNSFMRDHGAQLVLGTFTGTFAYCLIVLRTVQGSDGDGYSAFVPHLAVTGAVVLALLSVGMLIYYVHHAAVSMQVSAITAGVAHELERTITRVYPEHLGEGTDPPVRQAPPAHPEAFPVHATRSGYVQEIDSAKVLDLAREFDATIWLIARPGDFVMESGRLAAAHPRPADPERFENTLTESFVLGTDRTSYQDVGFAVQQLVEVALRGLSPGVNEPFTAVTCIDHLGQGLSKLANRRIPSAVRTDTDGTVRVVAHPLTFEELVEAAFEPIALYADRNPAIGERLLKTLGMLAGVAHREEDREAIGRVGSFVWKLTSKQVEEERHKSQLARLHEELGRALSRPARTRTEPAVSRPP